MQITLRRWGVLKVFQLAIFLAVSPMDAWLMDARAEQSKDDIYNGTSEERQHQPLYKFHPPVANAPVELVGEQKAYLSILTQSGALLPNFSGVGIDLGLQPGFFGFDFRLVYSEVNYGEIATQPNGAQVSTVNPDTVAEIYRPRQPSDRWSMLQFEPGFSLIGHLFSYEIPMMTERARIGLNYGRYSDLKNGITFTGFLFAVETGLQYHFGGIDSPLAVDASIAYRAGPISSAAMPDSNGVLPIVFVSSTLALLIWF
jgi:hypothetical protein